MFSNDFKRKKIRKINIKRKNIKKLRGSDKQVKGRADRDTASDEGRPGRPGRYTTVASGPETGDPLLRAPFTLN